MKSSNFFFGLIFHRGNLFLIVQLHFSKLFLILKDGVKHTSRVSISFFLNDTATTGNCTG